MFLATLVPMVLVVLWTHRRRLDAWVAVIGGGLVGCAPLLLWNAKNAWPSLDTPADVEGTYFERLRTFAEDLIPRAFGLRKLDLEWQSNMVVGSILYLAVIVADRCRHGRARAATGAAQPDPAPSRARRASSRSWRSFENLIFAC